MPCGPPKPRNAVLDVLFVLRDPAVHPDVGDPVRVVDVAQRAGQHRLGQVEAPAAVGGQGRVERLQPAVVVEAHPPLRVEAVPLAGHREVLGAVEPQPDRPAGEHGAERGDRREPVRLHLLAAEAAAHPQALHGDLVAVQAEHVRDDLLGLGRVLRAALDEDLPALVDEGQRGVRLEVEVLLAGELELAAEHVRRPGEAGLDVAAAPAAVAPPWKLCGVDRLAHRHEGRQRLGVDLDRRGAEPGRLDRLAEHPAHRVAVEHDLGREQRLVVLDARVVDAGDVGRGEHPHDTGHRQRRFGAQRRDAGVRVRDLDRVGVQHVLGAVDEVVGVQRRAGDVQGRALVRDRQRRPTGCPGRSDKRTHAGTSSAFSACSLSRLWPSIALR